jgi:hypothetical protein
LSSVAALPIISFIVSLDPCSTPSMRFLSMMKLLWGLPLCEREVCPMCLCDACSYSLDRRSRTA